MAPPRQLALFYRTLAELLDSGVPVTGALAHAGSLLIGAGGLETHIERGATLTQPLGAAKLVFPAAHLRLIAAGETSGRVEAVLRRLAVFCEQSATMWRKVLGGMFLPAAIFHFVALIAPVPAFFAGGTLGGYLASSVGFIVTVWVAIAVIGLLAWWTPATLKDALLRRLPWFGGWS